MVQRSTGGDLLLVQAVQVQSTAHRWGQRSMFYWLYWELEAEEHVLLVVLGEGEAFHPLPSLADLCRFESPLLPAENKPLEMSVLKRVKELLAEVDARTAAKHITVVDCTVRTPQEAPNRSIQRAAPALTCFIALWTGGSNPGREPRGAENDGSDVGAGAADAAARTPAEARPAGAVNKHPRRPPRPSLTQIWIIFHSSSPLPPLIITLQMFSFHLCCPLIFRRAFCESGFLRSRMKRGFCSCQV